MRIKAKCRTHPDSAVLLLAATTQYVKNAVPEYCSEEEEKAIGVELDEANLHCVTGSRYSDICHVYFCVVDAW